MKRLLWAAGMLLAMGSCFAAPAPNRAASSVVGWRGDGSGRYPEATPPTVWYRKENGETKNILWGTKLPCYSWSTPIIVGDKIFTRSEPYDLICLDKKTGRLLWIRSYPPFVAVTDAEKKAKPAWRELEPLVAELEKVNSAFVARGWSEDLYRAKHDLQKKIDDLTKKVDPKYELPRDMYVESWCGYTSTTPCSDGQFIYLTSGGGITACYDLNGKRMWARHESIAASWGEHGLSTSPSLYKGFLLVPIGGNLVVLNKTTGADVWRKAYPGNVNHGADGCWATAMPFSLGGNDYAIVWGHFVSLKDGRSFYQISFANATPVMQNNVAFFAMDSGGYRACQCEATPNGGLRVSTLTPEIKFPLEDEKNRWDPMKNYYSASPLYHDGLVYIISNWGNLVVVDARKGGMVYQKKLPFDFRNPQSRKSFGMGMGSSPALAGKYIYTTDSANCTIVMEPGREYKQVAKNTIVYTVPQGWEPYHWTGPHQEQTEACLVFEGNRLYLRGEQFLYCIGEK